jgi:hypothetical protein
MTSQFLQKDQVINLMEVGLSTVKQRDSVEQTVQVISYLLTIQQQMCFVANYLVKHAFNLFLAN